MDSDAAASPLAFRAASRAKSAMVRAESSPPFPAGFETHPVGRTTNAFYVVRRQAHPELGPPHPLPPATHPRDHVLSADFLGLLGLGR